MTKQASPLYKATISEKPDEAGFWRVFYYAPGMGFETGESVYIGRAQFRELAQAKEAQRRHESRNQ